MKFKSAISALIAPILLAGCATATVSLRSANSPAPGVGSSYASAAIQTEMSPNAYFGLLFLGYMMAGMHADYSRWSDGFSPRKPPELTQDRAIAERDCTKPLGQVSANLRCK